MDKTYKPQEVEQKWYKFWEEGGYFSSETRKRRFSSEARGSYFTPRIDPKKKPFVMMMPPPNVTGSLHIGHALVLTIEDIIVRYHRMKGEPTLYLPGKDHAAISAQNVVEKELLKEGLSRQELGREKFLERMWRWMEEYGSVIEDQTRRMGASCDWTRKCFTMDEGMREAVVETFNRLHKKGLIYQGERIINWCSRCGTVLSDLEVDHEEKKAKLWFVRYNLKTPAFAKASAGRQNSKPTFITVATTRPETMLGDTAVAVHPDDKRYQDLIGQKVILPLMNREIPIIADEVVDPEFGTGAVKITPAHDPTDFEIGQRHSLENIQVIGFDGKMTKLAGPYKEETVAVARGRVLEDLRKIDILAKEEDYTHSVGACERCGTTVEPLISKQWFVKMKPLAKPAIEAVKSGKIKIVPERFEKVYFHWMENIQDWCISRQLWWGHKIPLEGEEDTLDTWFSSGLWPFATLGWPKETQDFKYFYPTTVLETGYDILFFWVARMIMLGIEMTGKVPFETVYLHGLVRDKRGQKMSKSKGNVIDPIGFINEYGADALRMALIVGSAPGGDISLSEEKVRGYRNFSNKLWNITRFILSDSSKQGLKEESKQDAALKSLVDVTIKQTTEDLENFRMDLAAERLYHVVWDDFASVYLENYKKGLVSYSALFESFMKLLKLLHPFMPFITEEIYQRLPNKDAESIMIAPWPAS